MCIWELKRNRAKDFWRNTIYVIRAKVQVPNSPIKSTTRLHILAASLFHTNYRCILKHVSRNFENLMSDIGHFALSLLAHPRQCNKTGERATVHQDKTYEISLALFAAPSLSLVLSLCRWWVNYRQCVISDISCSKHAENLKCKTNTNIWNCILMICRRRQLLLLCISQV